jgi:peptidoglycan/LPS O-acetylase OafA/YrhL
MIGNTKKIDWIDGLKAFAIIAILLNHFVESFGGGPWFSNPSNNWPDFATRMATIFPPDVSLVNRCIKFLGWLGDMAPGVFLLLSGFTLTLSALKKTLQPTQFYLKRLLRIYPLYIAIHIFILIVAKLWFKWDIHFFSASTLLSIAGLRFKDSIFFYVNPSWWFIWTIVQLYILFPFLLMLLKKKGVKIFLAVTLAITVLSRAYGVAGIGFDGNLYNWMTGIFAGTRLFEFTFGMYLGYLFFKNDAAFNNLLSTKAKLFVISLGIYVLGFVCSWTYAGSIFSNIFITIGLSGLFYCIFETLFKKGNAAKSAVLWAGKNSFSVFLLHQPFLMYLGPLFIGTKKGLVLLAAIVLSFILGYCIERVVDYITKIVEAQKEVINALINKHWNKLLIVLLLLPAMAISFFIMYGQLGLERFLKPLLIFVLIAFLSSRVMKKDASAFLSKFFDGVIILSGAFLVITENWYSTYWLLVVLALLILAAMAKVRHSVSVVITFAVLLSGIIFLEKYVQKNKPAEILKWGEYPILQMDTTIGYSLIPNKTTHLKYSNYDFNVVTNSFGFCSPEINFAVKDSNEIRILVSGDAFSMPEGLAYNHSYPYLLEQQLRKNYPGQTINIIDAGVTGYGPNEELAQLKKYIALVKPDVVLNEFFVNEYDDITVSPKERQENIGFFVDQSLKKKYFGNRQTPNYLNNLLQEKTGRVSNTFKYNKSLLFYYKKDAVYYTDSVISLVSTYFDAMKNLCNANNARYMVMYVPGQIEVAKPKDMVYYPSAENLGDTSEFDFNRPQRIAKDLCVAKGIDFLNTTAFLKSYPAQPVYFPESWHWNNEGHKAAAEYLTGYFAKDSVIQKRIIKK